MLCDLCSYSVEMFNHVSQVICVLCMCNTSWDIKYNCMNSESEFAINYYGMGEKFGEVSLNVYYDFTFFFWQAGTISCWHIWESGLHAPLWVPDWLQPFRSSLGTGLSQYKWDLGTLKHHFCLHWQILSVVVVRIEWPPPLTALFLWGVEREQKKTSLVLGHTGDINFSWSISELLPGTNGEQGKDVSRES